MLQLNVIIQTFFYFSSFTHVKLYNLFGLLKIVTFKKSVNTSQFLELMYRFYEREKYFRAKVKEFTYLNERFEMILQMPELEIYRDKSMSEPSFLSQLYHTREMTPADDASHLHLQMWSKNDSG